MGVTSTVSFFQNVFYAIKEKLKHLSQNVVCKCFQFEQGLFFFISSKELTACLLENNLAKLSLETAFFRNSCRQTLNGLR